MPVQSVCFFSNCVLFAGRAQEKSEPELCNVLTVFVFEYLCVCVCECVCVCVCVSVHIVLYLRGIFLLRAVVLHVLLCGIFMLACVSFQIVFYLRRGLMARVSWNFVMYCLCI